MSIHITHVNRRAQALPIGTTLRNFPTTSSCTRSRLPAPLLAGSQRYHHLQSQSRTYSAWSPRSTPRTNLSRSLSISSKLQENVLQSSSDTVAHQDGSEESFTKRHIGPTFEEAESMLQVLDPPAKTLDDFVKEVIPADILTSSSLELSSRSTSRGNSASPLSEVEAKEILTSLGKLNRSGYKSLIGCGYADCVVPEPIKRNVLENPAWYTSYTPYQPEISQGRLESLLNFQTMVSDLTALPISNASVLDEATAAAEAMTMSVNALPAQRLKRPNKTFAVSRLCHPQTISVLESRAEGFGINISVVDVLKNSSQEVKSIGEDLIGVLAQYPDTEGSASDLQGLADATHKVGGMFSVATDLLALTVLKPPGEFGADIAFGNAQRFGVPLGYGGPHAAFFACSEKHKRKIPGRLVGVSKDRMGNKALRLALQTREQHIRREKATSNICTAQALLANMSAFYAIYHGPEGLRRIAIIIQSKTRALEEGLKRLGFSVGSGSEDKVESGQQAAFDTVVLNVSPGKAGEVVQLGISDQLHFNLRKINDSKVGITLDETVTTDQLESLFAAFEKYSTLPHAEKNIKIADLIKELSTGEDKSKVPDAIARTSKYLTHPVFNTHHSETELMRYIHHLQSKDLSLVHSMIPLGSCTMKLNAASELSYLSSPSWNSIHPFAPVDQAQGFMKLIDELESDLAAITGFDKVSVQPNSGAQGEFAGLRVIKKYQESRKSDKKRDICLIPVSAHGTNPASAAMAGMRVVTIKCEASTGNLEMADLKAKCEKYSEELGAIMITYPSTFGIFEPQIKEACEIVHFHGGQVYMDGANMNAQIGLCSPGEIGADVCHLNLHKTFCIPHGGGGPGVGPIGVKSHLAPFLPGHPLVKTGGETAIAPISAAPWGSASLLPISWAYIHMMGAQGLTHATKITLLNANYMLSRLKPYYKILYTNSKGRCAHEFILDIRPLKESAGIEAIDVAKRLQDYGFHAPTMSWPVANTLMIEPTESESKAELDRYCDALISIREEIKAVEKGDQPREGNVLKMAPHSMKDLLLDDKWDRSYSRQQAAYPLSWLKEKKFWPTVTRLDDSYGDMNLFCTCSPVDSIDGMTGVAAPAPT
ncbi:glycine decarboxylase subunit P [Agyrium rufum]|nr:glycine decarboxylase subunit P [Agyrium rufum]